MAKQAPTHANPHHPFRRSKEGLAKDIVAEIAAEISNLPMGKTHLYKLPKGTLEQYATHLREQVSRLHGSRYNVSVRYNRDGPAALRIFHKAPSEVTSEPSRPSYSQPIDPDYDPD